MVYKKLRFILCKDDVTWESGLRKAPTVRIETDTKELWYLFYIMPDGKLFLCTDLHSGLGLKLNGDGRLQYRLIPLEESAAMPTIRAKKALADGKVVTQAEAVPAAVPAPDAAGMPF